MDYNTIGNRQILISAFGEKLENDPNFYLTSPNTYVYNCIAFAMGLEDRWVDSADLPWHWWPPFPIAKGETNECLIHAFEYFGFEKCDMDDNIDEGFDKVVLYGDNGKWQHAAKVVENGIYHSKFGEAFDGLHSGGDVLEQQYGRPFLVMRRPKKLAHLTDNLKGVFVGYCRVTEKRKMNVNGEDIEDYIIFYKGKYYLERYGNEIIRVGRELRILSKI